MSHIPNSAMPHAGPSNQPEEKGGSTLGKIADAARENPKTAVAAGAAVVGAIAAAAIPLVRGRRKSGEEGESGKSGGTKKGGGTRKKSGSSGN